MANDALTPSQLAEEARQMGRDAATTGRRYAKDAMGAAGEKLRGLGDQATELQVACTRYVAADPVKAVLIAAAGGAALTALLIAFMRGGDRR